MTLPLSLETLEDRTMPSGLPLDVSLLIRLNPPAVKVLYRPGSGENVKPLRPGAAALAGMETIPAGVDLHVEAAEQHWRPLLVAIVEDAVRRTEEVTETVGSVAREALLPIVAKTVTEEKDADGTSAGTRGASVWDSPGANTARVSPGSLTWGQSARSPAVALPESPLALDLIALADATSEMPPPGPFADTVILDAWQGGLPLPQTEVVPAAEKDLTIIAAYLVGTPPARPLADATPPRAPDTGLTDFIVGRQESPPERAVFPTDESVAVPPRRPPDEEERPFVTDRGQTASARGDGRQAGPDAGIIPPVDGGGRPVDDPQDGDRDEE
jgi:hypothetical protein